MALMCIPSRDACPVHTLVLSLTCVIDCALWCCCDCGCWAICLQAFQSAYHYLYSDWRAIHAPFFSQSLLHRLLLLPNARDYVALVVASLLYATAVCGHICMHALGFGDCIRSALLTYCVMYAASDTGLQGPIIASIWHLAVVWGMFMLMSVSVGELAGTTAALVFRVQSMFLNTAHRSALTCAVLCVCMLAVPNHRLAQLTCGWTWRQTSKVTVSALVHTIILLIGRTVLQHRF